MSPVHELQLVATDCRVAKRLLVRCTNGHGYVGLVPPDTTRDSPLVRAIVRRLSRRKPINQKEA